MTAAIAAALRAHAAGLPTDEAGTDLLIGHGGFLHRDDFTSFVGTGTSVSDSTILMAWIDWHAALRALHDGRLPASSGERCILTLAASIAEGFPVSLRDTIPTLDTPNLKLLVTAIRHAAGHPPGHH